jgi:hypothetical protein
MSINARIPANAAKDRAFVHAIRLGELSLAAGAELAMAGGSKIRLCFTPAFPSC